MATLSLHHPFHPHALDLRELSQNCTVRCVLCALDFCGSAYCCFNCDMYLHESCASFPLQIQHPSHSEHSLNLSWYCLEQPYNCHGCGNSSKDYFMYCCDDCMFTLDITCAVSTLPPLGGHRDEEIIPHFAHDHPLALFQMDKNIRLTCKACNWKISGPAYGCGRCFFLLHESCAQLPREIPQHPLHNNHHALTILVDSRKVFQCKACEQHHPFTYRCSECEFNLGMRCAFSTLPLQDEQREDSVMIQHISHSHKLTYFSMAMESDIPCKVCLLKISGEVYGCTDCIFFLHKPCAELPKEMVDSLHPHTLYLKEKSGLQIYHECWCCDEQLSSIFYGCRSCHFKLNIGCRSFKLNNYHAALEEGVSLEIHHPFHQRPLVLHNFTRQRIVQCKVCQHPIKGLGYVSEESKESLCSNGYWLHTSCAGLPQELEHPCHPKHPLKLMEALDGSFRCDACNRKSKGYAFSCVECYFHLEIDCALRKPSLKHQLHEHGLIYFQRTEYLQCNRCGKKCDRDLYRCVGCNFNLHHGCVPLPPSAKHECHSHDLLLRDRAVDEFYDEHYCDLCETLRNPDHGVYYCEDCEWAAHIGCLIHIVEPEGKTEVQKSMLNKLDEEIASLKAGIKDMSMKLKALERKRVDMISPSLICEGDVEKLDAFEIKVPAYPSEKTQRALMKIQPGNKNLQSRLEYPNLSNYTPCVVKMMGKAV